MAQQQELENELIAHNEYQMIAAEMKQEESFQEVKMRNFMEDYYTTMKAEQGIDINYAIQ